MYLSSFWYLEKYCAFFFSFGAIVGMQVLWSCYFGLPTWKQAKGTFYFNSKPNLTFLYYGEKYVLKFALYLVCRGFIYLS